MNPVLAVASLVAFITYFVCLIVLHFLPTGYNPLYNTISDYSVGRFSRLARMSTAVNSVGILLLLGALVFIVGLPPLTSNGLIWLGILALTRLAMVVFITDLSGQKTTLKGIVHVILAVISFVAGVSAIGTLTGNISLFFSGNSVYPLLRILVEVSTPILVVLLITLLPSLRRIFGLIERLFLLTINVWLLIASGLVSAYAIGLLH